MRLAITLGVILIAAAIVVAVFVGQGSRKPPTAPTPTTTSTTPAPADAGPEATTTQAPADLPPTTAAPVAPTTSDVTPIEGLRAVPAESPAASELGSIGQNSYRLQVDISSYGAAVRKISLAEYHEDLEHSRAYVVQAPVQGSVHADGSRESRYPFAARGVWINDRYVDLQSVAWTKLADGHYRVEIVDAQGTPVLSIERHYVLDAGTYEVRLDQSLTSHWPQPLRVVWEQYGQGDVTADEGAYMGDRRDMISGYFLPRYDPQRRFVYSDDAYVHRTDLIKKYAGSPHQAVTVPFWPTERLPEGSELVWLASVNRYFAMVLHLPIQEGGLLADAAMQSIFPAPDIEMIGSQANGEDTRGLIFRLRSTPIDLAAGQSKPINLAIFAGPRDSKVFADPGQPYQQLGFDGLIRYNLGGPCSFCTFQWLAKGLLAFLRGIHFVTRDWGIAIIVLVLVVRALLHPITKRAQVNMMRMGKQMQALQPEIEKLKKKYKDDNQAMQREMMQLYKEKGVNPANALGCLPMFLQTPIWIALYAMLYYAIELRHVPAFYDVFSSLGALFGMQWHFLSDLSTADHFIKIFDQPRQINLWFIHPNFQAINLLPILMGVTFFFQQKLMSPPPANEQAEQTQKMMKWMTLLFPFMLYSAPSGLTLYILASTGAGIVDSLLVKKHVKKLEERGDFSSTKPGGPKSGGLMARITDMVAEKQKQVEAHRKQQGSAGGPRYKDRKR